MVFYVEKSEHIYFLGPPQSLALYKCMHVCICSLIKKSNNLLLFLQQV